MPEPKGTATLVGEVFPRVYRWTIHDDRIDAQSDSYAVVHDGHVVLIDPLPMAKQDLAKLGAVHAIVLTASCHERHGAIGGNSKCRCTRRPGRWILKKTRISGTTKAII
jgi:hypothetical protein